MSTSSLNILIEELEKLPGIGSKSAQKLAFHLLKTDRTDVSNLLNAIHNAVTNTKFCSICGAFSDSEKCNICSNEKRNHSQICVVEESSDTLNLERSNSYKGVYHVLHGVISPINGITSERLNIENLIKRVSENNIEEVIIAVNSNSDSEITRTFLTALLKPLNVKVTSLAFGLPVGGSLDYADPFTLSKAIEGRHEM